MLNFYLFLFFYFNNLFLIFTNDVIEFINFFFKFIQDDSSLYFKRGCQFAGISGDATYDFTRYFSGNVTGRYRYSDVIGTGREDNRYTVGAGLGWLPTKWMSLFLDYTFTKYNSNDRGNYDENRVWLRLTLQPDRPWRF